MAAKQKSEPTFGEQLEELEKIIRELESGRLDLDNALERFEKGVALTRKLRERLDAAEGRIEQLLATGEARSLSVE